MNEELLKKIGCGRRWTKGDKDRLYFDDEDLGYKYECYRSSGRISSAEIEEWPYLEGADMDAVNELAGEALSNKKATGLARNPHYIDLTTGNVFSFGFFEARIKYLILKAEKALEAEGKDPKGEDPETSLDELKELVLTRMVQMKYNFDFSNPDFLTDAFIKTFSNIKRSDDKMFALVSLEVKEKGSEEGNYIFKIAIRLKTKDLEIIQPFYRDKTGRVRDSEEERLNLYWKVDQEMRQFEKAHTWTDWTEEDPKDPTPTPRGGRAKKFPEAEAVEALAEAKNAAEVQQVIQKTKKEVLMKMARAIESITGTHVKSDAGRSTVEKILLENSEKLIGLDWKSAFDELEKTRSMRKWDDETVKNFATLENLKFFTYKQLIVVKKAWNIKVQASAKKAALVVALVEAKRAVA